MAGKSAQNVQNSVHPWQQPLKGCTSKVNLVEVRGNILLIMIIPSIATAIRPYAHACARVPSCYVWAWYKPCYNHVRMS